jgi:hypothetical protein
MSTNPRDVEKNLKDAMRYLQDERRLASNPIGTGFLKAQIYVLWLHQDGVGDSMTLDSLNARGNKTDRVDLIAATDSLLRQVEALAPVCAEDTREWRQSKPWIDRINKAYGFLSENQVDSATHYADRAALLFPSSPFVHNIYAQLADKRGDQATKLDRLRKAVVAARADTSLAETLRQMEFQLAMTAEQWAMTGGAAQKDALLAEAKELYTKLLRQEPGSEDAAYALSSVSQILSVAQDSAGAREFLAPIAEDPSPYHDLALLVGADLARVFSRNEDAMKLYAGALEKNPNTRDALYFLSFMYYEAKRTAAMDSLTQRLVAIDPSNPDNYLMRAYAFKLRADEEKDPARKAALIKQMNENSALENSMPHKLNVARFERRGERGAVLVGTIENRGKAAKSYTVKMEFLDMQGNVVETMTAEVASVAPGATGNFQMNPTKPGIAAYRYEALK